MSAVQDLAAGSRTLSNNLVNLLERVVEDLMQQEDGPLRRSQRLEQEQKGQRERLFLLEACLWPQLRIRCQHGFGKPDTYVVFALHASRLEIIEAHMHDDGREKRFERVDGLTRHIEEM